MVERLCKKGIYFLFRKMCKQVLDTFCYCALPDILRKKCDLFVIFCDEHFEITLVSLLCNSILKQAICDHIPTERFYYHEIALVSNCSIIVGELEELLMERCGFVLKSFPFYSISKKLPFEIQHMLILFWHNLKKRPKNLTTM